MFFSCLFTARGRKMRQCSSLWIRILFVQIPPSLCLHSLPLLSNLSLFLPFFPSLSSNICIFLNKSVLSIVHSVLRQSPPKGQQELDVFICMGGLLGSRFPIDLDELQRLRAQILTYF